MKDLITAVASLMLLLIFVLQFAGNQNLHTRMFRADMAIENFRDTAGLQPQIPARLPDSRLRFSSLMYPCKLAVSRKFSMARSARNIRVCRFWLPAN